MKYQGRNSFPIFENDAEKGSYLIKLHEQFEFVLKVLRRRMRSKTKIDIVTKLNEGSWFQITRE